MEDRSDPRRYEIRIRGTLGDGLLSGFPGLAALRRRRETLLIGDIADQAALLGVIARIESLGLELLEVRRARPQRSVPGRRPSGETSPRCATTQEPDDERPGR